MNKKKIDKLIPLAINAIDENFQTLQNKDKTAIDKRCQGYLASFGPTVISCGIVKTVAIYADTSDSNKLRRKILEIMFSLIGLNVDNFIKNETSSTNYALKNKILEANIACKLSIRTFELKD